ncbi:MAG: tetratricopeptide repeat protein [Phycisphaeraceae bacterium]|nr:MAG: tetratricopeptide repeat protein [Phycisphaeraceae bacterium]
MQPPADAITPSTPEHAVAATPARSPWREVWQVPVMAAGLVLLISGGYSLVGSNPDPDFDGFLLRGERLILSGANTEAIGVLNTEVYPYLATAKVSDEQRARFHTLIARAIARGQADLGINREDNNKNIVASYLEAEAYGARLEPEDLSTLAMTYVAMDDLDRAKARADRLPAPERARRMQIVRGIVDRALRPGSGRDLMALTLLTEMLTDPSLDQDTRAWALGRHAELQIGRGYAEEAIGRLLREMPLLDRADKGSLANLHLLLGEAYTKTGPLAEAQRQLDHASALLEEHDPAGARLRLAHGLVAAMGGDHETARARFESVLEFTDDDRYATPAVLGIAETAAAMGDYDASLDAFTRLADRLAHPGAHGGVDAARAVASMTDRADERFGVKDDRGALALVNLAERVLPGGSTPAPTLRRLAECHRRLGDAILTPILSGRDGVLALVDLDPSTRAQVKTHLTASGVYFRRLADKVAMSDPAAWAEATWSAGEAFDRSGEQEQAVASFLLYLTERPGDPRQAEARFRLAQAYQARGDFGTASKHYATLILGRQEDLGAGPWADLSEVPLAQCMLLDHDADNDAEAERRLTRVAAGSLGGPDTPAFRDAVFELGSLYYRQGNTGRAIERLDEFISRYPGDPRVLAALFQHADAMRVSASEIKRALASEAMPASQRLLLQQTREQRLRGSIGVFERVRRELEGKDAQRRTAIEDLYLRNASFYLGECAFELGDWDAAVTYYAAARDRYANDPASLVAMTQIVTCHLRQGDPRRARAANERAKRFYASMPAAVWDDPNLPMTREDWERWLAATSELWSDERQRAGADDGGDAR